jgi:hypothetical protein
MRGGTCFRDRVCRSPRATNALQCQVAIGLPAPAKRKFARPLRCRSNSSNLRPTTPEPSFRTWAPRSARGSDPCLALTGGKTRRSPASLLFAKFEHPVLAAFRQAPVTKAQVRHALSAGPDRRSPALAFAPSAGARRPGRGRVLWSLRRRRASRCLWRPSATPRRLDANRRRASRCSSAGVRRQCFSPRISGTLGRSEGAGQDFSS